MLLHFIVGGAGHPLNPNLFKYSVFPISLPDVPLCPLPEQLRIGRRVQDPPEPPGLGQLLPHPGLLLPCSVGGAAAAVAAITVVMDHSAGLPGESRTFFAENSLCQPQIRNKFFLTPDSCSVKTMSPPQQILYYPRAKQTQGALCRGPSVKSMSKRPFSLFPLLRTYLQNM